MQRVQPYAVIYDRDCGVCTRFVAGLARWDRDAVLVPTFNDPADRVALQILADLFPGRRIVGIHATDLVWGLGTLHCLTQQQPAARSGA